MPTIPNLADIPTHHSILIATQRQREGLIAERDAVAAHNQQLCAAIDRFGAALNACEWAWNEFSGDMQEAWNALVESAHAWEEGREFIHASEDGRSLQP